MKNRSISCLTHDYGYGDLSLPYVSREGTQKQLKRMLKRKQVSPSPYIKGARWLNWEKNNND